MIMYRQALVLPGGITASTAQCESMLVGAIHACERYYPAFQFVVWAGKIAAEAMSCGDVRHRGRGVGFRALAHRVVPANAGTHTARCTRLGKMLVAHSALH